MVWDSLGTADSQEHGIQPVDVKNDKGELGGNTCIINVLTEQDIPMKFDARYCSR